jgi:hypothetical protein
LEEVNGGKNSREVGQELVWSASTSNYIGYSNLIELELHSEQEREFHLEIPDEPINVSLIDQGEIEFEVVEYPNNSNPHPPPEEPIYPENIFDNLDGNNEAMSLKVPLPASQPSEDSIQDDGNMEGNCSLQIPNHY